MYSFLPERGAWQSAAQLRAVCQGVIPAVAPRSIWAQSLAIGWIPRPTVLHWVPCLMLHSVKLICDGLSRPKLNTNCLSWHTISWHYTFNTVVALSSQFFPVPFLPRTFAIGMHFVCLYYRKFNWTVWESFLFTTGKSSWVKKNVVCGRYWNFNSELVDFNLLVFSFCMLSLSNLSLLFCCFSALKG
jgi:hypothetical protein